jgi:hypothetical protein
MRNAFLILGMGICFVGIMLIAAPSPQVLAQQTGDQNMLNLSFIGKGVSNQGTRILQTGDLSNLSTAVATATLTRVVAAPASGSTYIRSIAVEKSTGAGGSFTLQYGTGTNCGTGTTVLIGPVTNPPIQTYYLGAIVPAGQDLCAQTDASTTSIRLLYN